MKIDVDLNLGQHANDGKIDGFVTAWCFCLDKASVKWFYAHCDRCFGGNCGVLGTQHRFGFSRFKERLCTSWSFSGYPGPFFYDVIF